MATITEIAELAGVSIGTVDRVLHNRGYVKAETRERVEKACEELQYEPNRVAQGLAVRKKKLKFLFMIPKTQYSPFFIPVRESAEKKAKSLEAYAATTDIIEYPDSAAEEAELIKTLKKSIGEYDGVCITGTVSPINDLIIAEQKKRDIPLVFYNSRLDGVEHLAYVGCDYIASGRLAAGLTAMAGGDDAKICFFTEYDSIKESATERIRGFSNEMSSRYPDMELLGRWSISLDREENKRSVKEMFVKYPETNVVYVINPRDYDICRLIAAEDTDHKIRIITNDLVAVQYEMFHKGLITATICQEPEKQGKLSLEILFNYLAYGTVPKKVNYTELSIHIEQNI